MCYTASRLILWCCSFYIPLTYKLIPNKMNGADKLVSLGIRGINDLVKKLDLYGDKKEIFDAWMEWRKERDIEQGVLEGKSRIINGIKEILEIE